MDHDEHDVERSGPALAEGGPPADPLLALRAELEDVDALSLDDRAEVFDRTHAVVVRELRALELG